MGTCFDSNHSNPSIPEVFECEERWDEGREKKEKSKPGNTPFDPILKRPDYGNDTPIH